MEMWCWWGWRGVSTNNASLSFGRTSAGIVSCFFWGLCDTICELFVWMYILTKLSLLSTNVWANLSYLFYLGEVKVDTNFLGRKRVSERFWAKLYNPGRDILHILGQYLKYVSTFWWKRSSFGMEGKLWSTLHRLLRT